MCWRDSRPRPRVSPPPSPPWGAAWSITREGGGRGKKAGGSESESWHAEPGKLRVVTSAVLGRTFKNEPFLHFVEGSLLPPL